MKSEQYCTRVRNALLSYKTDTTPLLWGLPYGWRSGPALLVSRLADIVQHEREQNSDILVSDILVRHLESARLYSVWLCRSRKDARRYGTPYKVYLPPTAIVVAIDNEDETGYLVSYQI